MSTYISMKSKFLEFWLQYSDVYMLCIFMNSMLLHLRFRICFYETILLLYNRNQSLYWFTNSLTPYTHSPAKQIKALRKRIQQTYIWLKEAYINRMLVQQHYE